MTMNNPPPISPLNQHHRSTTVFV